MRRGLAALALCLWAGPASAADASQSRAIGYSADWQYFAFEQYGIQDGSGFPFWEIFVLDLKADAWVKGTPVQAVIDDEAARLTGARAKAYAAAKPVLDRLGNIEPSNLLQATPATEGQADRSVARFDAYYNSAGPYTNAGDRGQFEISVKPVPVPRPSFCTDPDVDVMGMEVTLRNRRSGTTVTLARDTSIPQSRGCPGSYDIDSIHAPASYGSGAANVALIGVYSRGFEGWDRQVIAIPFAMPD